MGRADSPALRGTLLGRLLRYWNPIMRRLLDSPLHWPLSRWFLLLSWTGRRTGAVYTTPVSYVSDGTDVFITTGDRWWRHLVGNTTTQIRFAGRWISARAVPITDPEQSAREHERLFRMHPWYGRLAGIPATTSGNYRTALARSIAAGRTLVRIELVGAPRGTPARSPRRDAEAPRSRETEALQGRREGESVSDEPPGRLRPPARPARIVGSVAWTSGSS